jgi:hypothetical protein
MSIESLQRANSLLAVALDILDESEAEVTAALVSSAIDALGFERGDRIRQAQIAAQSRLVVFPVRRSCA